MNMSSYILMMMVSTKSMLLGAHYNILTNFISYLESGDPGPILDPLRFKLKFYYSSKNARVEIELTVSILV